MDKDNRTVLHLTRVVLDLFEKPLAFDKFTQNKVLTSEDVRVCSDIITCRLKRIQEMCVILTELKFKLTYEKNAIYAESADVEAQEIKGILKSRGYKDTEFQVILEYVRKWGML